MKTAHPTSACRQAQQGHAADARPWVEKKTGPRGQKGSALSGTCNHLETRNAEHSKNDHHR